MENRESAFQAERPVWEKAKGMEVHAFKGKVGLCWDVMTRKALERQAKLHIFPGGASNGESLESLKQGQE